MTKPPAMGEARPYAPEAPAAIGVGVAAITLAAMAVPVQQGIDDPAVVAGGALAVVAVVAFLGSRYGRIDRRIAGSIAAGSSLAVSLLAGYALNQGLLAAVTIPTVEWSISLLATAFVTAAIATSIGVADFFRLSGGGLKNRAFQTVLLLVVAIVGWFGAQVATILIGVPIVTVFGSPSDTGLIAITQLGTAVGTGAIAAGYLVYRQYEWSYIDITWPNRWDLFWMVGGVAILFGAVIAISLVFQSTGVESADHGTAQEAAVNPELMLVMIPAAIVIIGPFEELLYRNIIQKSLYESFSRYGAVIVGSVIFAAIHLPAYGTAGPGQILASLAVVFGLSIVLGAIYERTENLLVPAIVHGVYDAIVFANLYFMYA